MHQRIAVFPVHKTKDSTIDVSRDAYIELLDIAELYVTHLREIRRDQKALDKAMRIIKEMRFCASFNMKFRQDTYAELQELLDDMYIELNS